MSGSGLVDAIKTVEDPFMMFGINSGTIVANFNDYRFCAPRCRQANVRAAWTVLDRIDDNIDDGLSKDQPVRSGE